MIVDNEKPETTLKGTNLELANRITTSAATVDKGQLLFDEDRLKIYYDRIFPFQLMFKWISYNKLVQRDNKSLISLEDGTQSTYFHKREFSFTLANDVYCRYLCFRSAEQFK